ncbi:hypothetical protein AB1L42_04730 [Thalassoglobus sp. JC818]|uniref:hypothetical protein n=1 Tax=Thalassoglobus sp. JC818 TaxID=3232136 RepID=UPI003459C124
MSSDRINSNQPSEFEKNLSALQPQANQRLRDQILYAAGERAAELRLRDSEHSKADRRSSGLWKFATAASWIVTAGLLIYSVQISPGVVQIVEVPTLEPTTDQQPELTEKPVSSEQTPRQPTEQQIRVMAQSDGQYARDELSLIRYFDTNQRSGEIRIPESSLPDRKNSSNATYAELSQHLRPFSIHVPRNGETL